MAESTALLQSAIDWVQELLRLMGYPSDVQAEFRRQDENEPEDANCWMTIDHRAMRPHQIQALLGIDGQNLDAMQYLANLYLNPQNPEERHCFFTLEFNGYRQARHQELQQIAETAAAKVRETGQEYQIQDLSSADRRLVHMFLKDYSDVETFSQGKEPHRYLIVRLMPSE